jgi:hypothetical protein
MRSWVKEKSHVSVKAVEAAVDAQWVEGLGIFLSLNPTMSRSAVILAARSPCDTTVLEVVLKMGGNPNSEGQSPCFALGEAASARNVHPQDVEKRTALVQVVLAAVKSADSIRLPGYLKMIALLVRAGARTDQAKTRVAGIRKLSSRGHRIVAALEGSYP